jgi:hypothetical protein
MAMSETKVINEGSQAFPSLRDWFAGQALQGI